MRPCARERLGGAPPLRTAPLGRGGGWPPPGPAGRWPDRRGRVRGRGGRRGRRRARARLRPSSSRPARNAPAGPRTPADQLESTRPPLPDQPSEGPLRRLDERRVGGGGGRGERVSTALEVEDGVA